MRASPSNTTDNNKRLFAVLSLGLLLAGLLAPILIAAFGRAEFAFTFGVAAAVLALSFGVLSWSDRIGRAVAIILLSVLVVGGGGSAVIYMIRSQHIAAASQR